mmetsp:Transcript_1552/g.4592  ORF Transcript_1552/g.4592 Transcript_1552/m.4592 type:complete len:218 (+) Transcript_1552:2340-2993(+)
MARPPPAALGCHPAAAFWYAYSSPLRRLISSRSCAASPWVSSFLNTVFWMALTRWAKRRVLRVSAMLATAGLTLAIMIVFALPPKESLRRKVRRELRYGTCWTLPRWKSTRLMMTFPSTVRLTLMPDASFSRSPVAPLCRCRSLPARSTRLRRDDSTEVMPLSSNERTHSSAVNTECDRLDSLFISVSPLLRVSWPLSSNPATSSILCTICCERRST